MQEFELGYTPINLRKIIESQGWTQAYAAELLSVSDTTLSRWLMPINVKTHADMPYRQWLRLLTIVGA